MNDDRFFTEPYYGIEIVSSSDKKRQELFEEWKERLTSEWQDMPGGENALKKWEQHVTENWNKEMMEMSALPNDDMVLEGWAQVCEPVH